MDIALLNKDIMFQKNELVTDSIGNHSNIWTDYYKCKATISGEGTGEERDAGVISDRVDLGVTVRWCKKVRDITTTGYRIILDGDIYNIIGIDHFSYKNKALKFKCEKVRR